ncbi:ImpA family type VI secretion system protein [Yersinia sp. LJYL362]|uniref:type VI secretion system protein TssA n=1 Tax=Yersinia sp. LJYL362 TaxID=3402108 RepID=UPI003AB80F1C
MFNTFPQASFGIEYDPAYGEIESILSQLDESADPLSRSHEPPNINWHYINELATKLLDQCSDLRVIVWLIRANIQNKGIFALYESLMNLSQLIKDNSAVIYPQSEEEPFNGGHAAALGWLATTHCIAEIKEMRIIEEYSYTLQDMIVTEPTLSGQECYSITPSSLLITVDNYFQKNCLPSLQEQLSGIDRFLEEISLYANQCSDGYQLNCNLLQGFFKKNIFQLSLLNELPRDYSELSDSKSEVNEDYEIAYLSSNDKRISSRQEVIMMLDRILEYFQYYEPSHPAPIFIYRTKEMIGMDFYSIVEEILPEAVIALKQLAGKNNPPFR